MNLPRSSPGQVERADPSALPRARSRPGTPGSGRSRFRSGRRGPSAFTLVETLLALALLTSVLLALNLFLFSMAEIWGRNRQERLFGQHVRAVTRYLDELLVRGSRTGGTGRELRLAPPKGTGLGDPQLTFELPAGDRLLPWPEAPLPDVECSLSTAAGKGLVLSWHSRWETGFEDTAPRTLVVSPLVRQIEYLYFDAAARTWQATAAPTRDRTDEWPLPSRLRLHFHYDRFAATAVVTVPPRLPALPAF